MSLFKKRNIIQTPTYTSVSTPLLWTEESDPTVKACVDKIANTLSVLPLELYAYTKNGKKLAISNPLFKVLEKPTIEETPSLFYSTLIRQMLLEGNAYVFVSRDAKSDPIAFTLINSKSVKIKRNERGAKVFCVGDDEFSERQVLHIPYIGAGYNGTYGMSPIKLMSDTINLHITLLSYLSAYFQNSLGSRYALELGDSYGVKEMDKVYGALMPAINKFVIGAKNGGKMMITPPDTKMSKIDQPSNAESDLHSLIKMVEAEIAQGFNIPPECLDTTQQKYGSLEMNQGNFLSNCIQPLGNHICQSFEKLIPAGSGALFIAYEYKNLLTTDTKSTIEYLAKQVQTGLLTQNEARQKLGMDDIGEQGDYYWMPSNLIPATEENIKAIFAKSKIALGEGHNPQGDDKE